MSFGGQQGASCEEPSLARKLAVWPSVVLMVNPLLTYKPKGLRVEYT